jgi:hypothetical protein
MPLVDAIIACEQNVLLICRITYGYFCFMEFSQDFCRIEIPWKFLAQTVRFMGSYHIGTNIIGYKFQKIALGQTS